MTEREVFLQALEIDDPVARAGLIEHACAGQPQLRQAVEQLLKAHNLAGEFLKEPHPAAAASEQTGSYAPESPIELAGTVIAGKYKLLQKIGEGGMGSVWMADQLEPVKRRVAVKLIKAEREGSHAILSRFEAERQAIALMDHPSIAKLLDAGQILAVAPSGSSAPYFVMELVKGTPLTEYCDDNKLSITDRLKLFMQICSAVQHAHQKGIIHRDLKPTNILVESHDDKPVPKVIDFGMAKALSGHVLTEHTLFTGFGTVAGTPLYMAPEQAKFNAIDIDTRADIYALGVILYELLTGTTPIERATLKKAALDEILRVIRESEPPAPSKRLSSSDSKPSIAAVRQTEPVKLGRFVKGELDWIVMKALSKERDRRYETANGFAKDVERFLNHEPIVAGPPSARYKLRKFVQRNKAQVTAACLVLVTLLAGIAGTSWGFYRESQRAEGERLAKQDAQEKEKLAVTAADKEREARLEEERQRKFAEGINRFVVDDFLSLTSVEGQDRFGGEGKDELNKDTTLQQLLDRAAQKLRTRKDLEPRVEAQLCWIIGVNYRANGLFTQAVEFLERAVKIRSDHLGRDHVDTLDAMNSLGVAYNVAGLFPKALPLLEATLVGREAKLGADDRDTIKTRRNLAWAYHKVGQREKALSMFEAVLKVAEAKLGSDDPLVLLHRADLAHAYLDAGKLDKAVPLYEATLTAAEAKLGASHSGTLTVRGDLAVAYYLEGQLNKALALSEANLKAKEGTLGANHPSTLASRNNLAMAYQGAGFLDKALPLLEATLKAREATLGADHPDTLTSRNNLAIAYDKAGLLDKALPLLETTLKAREATLGADHPDTLSSGYNLASAYQIVGNLNKALPLWEHVASGMEKRKYEHVIASQAVSKTIDAYEQAKEFSRAESWRRKWLAHIKEKSGTDSPAYVAGLTWLGLNLLQQSRWAEAETELRNCLGGRKKLAPDAWTTFNTESMLGVALMGQKKYAEAEPLLIKAYDGMKQREDKIPKEARVRLVEAIDRLIELYTTTNKPDEVKKWQDERAKYPESKPVEKN